MLQYPTINPVALKLGPLKIHWYGITYLVGFVAFWWLGNIRAKRDDSVLKPEQVSDFLFYGVIGVVIGGRLGSVLFYNLDHFLSNPLMIFRIWEGGMSFHGGLLGVITAMWLYQRAHGFGFWRLADFIAPLVPIGLGAGRIGNFINGELWGGPASSAIPWAMRVPCENFHRDVAARLCESGSNLTVALHPSQLYQACLEGIVLFAILWIYSSKARPLGAVSGLFLLGYGVFRFLVEFLRMPDYDIGYLAFGWVTMGQVLSLPMIIAGLALIWFGYRNHPVKSTSSKA